MNNLFSRTAKRTILVETGSDPGLLKLIIHDAGHEVFLSFSRAIVEQIPRIVCRALDRKMDLHLAKNADCVGGTDQMASSSRMPVEIQEPVEAAM